MPAQLLFERLRLQSIIRRLRRELGTDTATELVAAAVRLELLTGQDDDTGEFYQTQPDRDVA